MRPNAAEPAAGDRRRRRRPRPRVVVIGDSDFAANFGLGIQGNRDLFMNALELAVAAGGAHRRAAALARGSPADDDGRSAAAASSILSIFLIPAADLRRGRLHLVAEAVAHARSVVDAGTGGRGRGASAPTSISSIPSGPTPRSRRRCSPSRPTPSTRLRVVAKGDTSVLRKADGGWKLVEPLATDADQNEVTALVSSLASLEHQPRGRSQRHQPGASTASRRRRPTSRSRRRAARPAACGSATRRRPASDIYALKGDDSRVFLVATFAETSLARIDVRPARQTRAALRARQGRRPRDHRRRRARLTLSRADSELARRRAGRTPAATTAPSRAC